jgi:hypothetical protein
MSAFPSDMQFRDKVILAIFIFGILHPVARTLSGYWKNSDRLCGLVVRVLGYRSGGPGSIPGTTRKKK